MDIGCGFQPFLGDAHVAACGMEIEGLRPFDASRWTGLQAASESKRGVTHIDCSQKRVVADIGFCSDSFRVVES